MTDLNHIKHLLDQLSLEELASFSAWFEEHQVRLLDAAIEREAKSGKLDWLADELRADRRDRAGQSLS